VTAQPQEDLGLTRRELRAAQTGDREALDALFARYLPRVRAMVAARAGRTLRQLADVEDLVQETMQDALLGLPQVDQQSEGLFAHWLARCVENNLPDPRALPRA
jgi:DNA-directed RNA polymerase specialized sigma24 family protein